MQYRSFGKTGEQVSALGFGCMRLPTLEGDNARIDEKEAIRMIRRAIDGGLNYVDTAYNYHGGNSEIVVGKALKDGYRQKALLATKNPVFKIEKEEDFDRLLDEQLNKLDVDSIDFYLLHALNLKRWNEVVLKFDILPKLVKAKKDGKVRHIGFSFHDDLAAFKTMVDGFDGWDFCQIQFNYINTDYQAGLEGLRYAASRGLGVVVMEPLLGGALAAPSDKMKQAMHTEKSAVQWSLDYIWNYPEVSLLLSGMSTMEQVEDNLRSASHSAMGAMDEQELEKYGQVKKIYDESHLVPCTECQYCMPCPFGLNIPGIYAAYNATAQSTMERAGAMYAKASEKGAGACTGCKHCEQICPQHIESSRLMPEIHEVFGK